MGNKLASGLQRSSSSARSRRIPSWKAGVLRPCPEPSPLSAQNARARPGLHGRPPRPRAARLLDRQVLDAGFGVPQHGTCKEPIVRNTGGGAWRNTNIATRSVDVSFLSMFGAGTGAVVLAACGQAGAPSVPTTAPAASRLAASASNASRYRANRGTVAPAAGHGATYCRGHRPAKVGWHAAGCQARRRRQSGWPLLVAQRRSPRLAGIRHAGEV